jgi:hypothetical protein
LTSGMALAELLLLSSIIFLSFFIWFLSELLECEYCDGHFCRLCLKLSAAEYRLLGKRKDFHWYCPSCEEKALRNIKMEKEIEERCRDYFDRYESSAFSSWNLALQSLHVHDSSSLHVRKRHWGILRWKKK